MSGTATDYTQKQVLAHTLNYGTMTRPTSLFVGLCTSTPSAQVPGTEVVGNGYQRIAGTFADASFSVNSIASNTTTIEFPAASAPWGTIGWFEIWDALTAGNRLYWGTMVDPGDGSTPITRSVQTGDIVRFSAGVMWVQAI